MFVIKLLESPPAGKKCCVFGYFWAQKSVFVMEHLEHWNIQIGFQYGRLQNDMNN